MFNTRKYTYNKRNQLTGEEQNIVVKTNTHNSKGLIIAIDKETYDMQNTYSYRTDGRIESVNNREYNYDAKGMLTDIADNRFFTYDSYGNRVGETGIYGNKSYTYKYGLLTAAGTARYGYNADGVRCEKTYNGVTTKYILDGNKILGEVQSGLNYKHWTITDGKRHVQYFYDCEGITGAMIGPGMYEYVKDALGNVLMLIDQDDGKVARFYRYYAFGNCTVLDCNG